MSPKNILSTFKNKKSRMVSSLLLSSALCVIATTGYTAEKAKVEAEATPTPTVGTSPSASAACPLNSGGPSLVNSRWFLSSIYGQDVPTGLKIGFNVGVKEISGNTGCNDYTAKFSPVGLTGFRVTKVGKTKKVCRFTKFIVGGPSVSTGDWEGSYIRTLMRMGSVQHKGKELHFYNRNGQTGMIMVEAPKEVIADTAN